MNTIIFERSSIFDVDLDIPASVPQCKIFAHCAKTKIQFSQLWDLIETWGFREDIKDVKAIGLMMMTPPKKKAHCAKTKIQFSQLWDLIDTWGFRENINDVKAIGLMMMTHPHP